MTKDFHNPLRPGSAGYLAIEAVKEHGPLAPEALALTIGKPTDELAAMLGFPVREKLLRIQEDGRYALGVSVPAARHADVSPPTAVSRPSAQPPTAPEARADGVDIDAVHRRRDDAQVQLLRAQFDEHRAAKAAAKTATSKAKAASAAVPPNHEIPPAPPAPSALPPTAVASQSPMQVAAPAPRTVDDMARQALERIEGPAPRQRVLGSWRSDGIYVIEKGLSRIELDRDEAIGLFEHMAAMARAA